MLVLSFYGYSNSGKTFLVTQILRELAKRAIPAAAVKISPRSTIDTQGKDTMHYVEAGATQVVARCKESTAFLYPGSMEMDEILQRIEEFNKSPKPRVVLVEGMRDTRFPKVAVGEVEGLENTVLHWRMGDGYGEILDYIERRIENG